MTKVEIVDVVKLNNKESNNSILISEFNRFEGSIR